MSDLVSIEEALRVVLSRAQPLETETVALADAHGRVLAEPARAVTDLPPFPSSAMDGFAVRARDLPASLEVVDAAPAGRPAARVLGAGEAIAVATGGVVPEGADAVVPIEHVDQNDNMIRITTAVAQGDNVRARGGDIRAGDEVVAAGIRLRAGHVGALAAAGVTTVVCGRRPRVTVVTTGTELRRPGESLGPGEIYESNGSMLAALLGVAGADVHVPDAVEDDEEQHRTAIRAGLAGDVLVTSGGVSVGPHDLVRRVARELGVEELFWGVAMRPGKPLAFGVSGKALVFGLPGNPVSSLVGGVLFVRPALLALQGAIAPEPVWDTGLLAAPLRRAAARDDLVRAFAETGADGVVLTPVTGQESHMIVRAARADALVHVPRGEGELAIGATVRYLRLD